MTLEENDINWENYFINGTDVLKNKLGIINNQELLIKEVEITAKRLLELYMEPLDMGFGKEHLKGIHRYLFGDIYPFAGEYRNVYMEKNNSYFARVEEIDKRLDEIFVDMERDIKRVSNKYDYASFLAEYYVLLLVVHPFREGNGRTIREFIREYANKKSKDLPFGEIEFLWSNVNGEEINSIINKAIAYRSGIEIEFMKAIVPLSLTRKK